RNADTATIASATSAEDEPNEGSADGMTHLPDTTAPRLPPDRPRAPGRRSCDVRAVAGGRPTPGSTDPDATRRSAHGLGDEPRSVGIWTAHAHATSGGPTWLSQPHTT